MTTTSTISVITSRPLPLDVLSACYTNWCLTDAFIRLHPILLCHFCFRQSPLTFFHHSHCPLSNSSILNGPGSVAMRTWGIFLSLRKVATVQSDDVHRSTYSLESAVELFTQLSGKESSLHFPVFAFSNTAGGRAPALSFVVSLRTVLCLTGL